MLKHVLAVPGNNLILSQISPSIAPKAIAPIRKGVCESILTNLL